MADGMVTFDPEERLAPNFLAKEFLESFVARSMGCTDDDLYTVPSANAKNIREVLAPFAQKLRDKFGVPVHINGANRLMKVAVKLNGNTGSAHCYSLAMDVTVEGKTPEQVVDAVMGNPSKKIPYDPELAPLVDQAIVERGCAHFGFPVPPRPAPRGEVRTEQIRGPQSALYPLIRVWRP